MKIFQKSGESDVKKEGVIFIVIYRTRVLRVTNFRREIDLIIYGCRGPVLRK